MIAALYVDSGGPYSGLVGVQCWGVERDARRYAGPWPVVAHPPCQRWGAYWSGGPSAQERRELGDDGGCFASALAAVRQWGGVLEHPSTTKAWKAFGLQKPPRSGGWVQADDVGWTCCVEQGHYGHRARKATWLYAVNVALPLPELLWGPSAREAKLAMPSDMRAPRAGMRAERRAERRAELARISAETGKVWACPEMMCKREREETPIPFRNLLLGIAIQGFVPMPLQMELAL